MVTIKLMIDSPTDPSNIHGTISNVEYIVLHTSGRSRWASDKGELSYLRGKHSNKFCYHDYIFSTGECHNLAPINSLLWHAGAGKINGKIVNMNNISIGVGMGGENLPSSIYPKEQYDATVKVLANRAKQLGLDASKIVGHHEVSGYRGKTDPAAFDMNKCRNDVRIQMLRNEIPKPNLLKQAPRTVIVVQGLQGNVIYRGNYLVTDFGDKIHCRETE